MQALSDLNYSLRLVRKTPGFSILILLVIVVSLSFYLASYTLGNMMSHEPMPFPNGDSYVDLRAVDAESGEGVGFPDFDIYLLNRLSEVSGSYIELGAYAHNAYVFSDGEYSRSYTGVAISTGLFQGLGTNPALGRVFSNDDSLPGADKVVIITDSLWREHYNEDINIIGRSSLIDGIPHTIIGVMPENFGFPRSGNFWFPLQATQATQPGDGQPIALVGVLQEGVSYSEAELELTELLAREAVRHPEHYANLAAKVYDYSDSYAGPGVTFPLPVYMNFVTFVILAIAIVNLTSLLLIRFSTRVHELAIRSSLGANGWQLSKQIILESLAICVIGLVLSYFLSTALLKFFEYSLLEQGMAFNYWFTFELDLRGFVMGAFCIVLIWLTSSALVAFKAYKSGPGGMVALVNKGDSSANSGKAMSFIVGIELVLCSFLLICCGAIIHLMLLVSNLDYGVDPDGIAVASFSLTHADYDDQQRRLRYLEDLQSAAIEIPGLMDVAVTSALPQSSGITGMYSTDEFESSSEERLPSLTAVWVSNSYFRTADVQLLQGRLFDGSDTTESDNVTILTEDFARQLWPNESAIGKSIQITIGSETASLRVVGVVSNVLHNLITGGALPSLYRPMSQGSPKNLFLLLRHQPNVNVPDLESALRESATAIDRNIPLVNVRTLDDQIFYDQQAVELIAVIFILLAMVTLLLASIGTYSVMARAIQLRTREIGIRRAVGSTNSSIAWKFIGQGMWFLLIGIGVGGGLASIVVSATATLLGLDDLLFLPVVLTLVILLMFLVVLSATWIPARKAIAMEPGDALRYE